MDLNNCNFTGRLVKDAMSKVVNTGSEVKLVYFDLANNTGYGDREKTLYVTCNLWGKLGENVKQYLVKGKSVAVTGALEMQSWTGKDDGALHQKLVLTCKEVVLLSSGASAHSNVTEVEAEVVDVPPVITF